MNPQDFFQFLGGFAISHSIVTAVKLIFYILDAVLAALFVYVFRKSLRFRTLFREGAAQDRRTLTLLNSEFIGQWREIEEKAGSELPETLKIAIIEADKLVDNVLRRVGIPGEHMADRLEHLPADELKSLEALWRAHRLRNDIVHTPGFDLSPAEAKRTLSVYEAFLKEIGVL
ncbi:MAG: hypothetical protein HY456_01910 [Parcubacteria group bacterium]|nr:hypothetical protein [Parcubacteria group bacterium]